MIETFEEPSEEEKEAGQGLDDTTRLPNRKVRRRNSRSPQPIVANNSPGASDLDNPERQVPESNDEAQSSSEKGRRSRKTRRKAALRERIAESRTSATSGEDPTWRQI